MVKFCAYLGLGPGMDLATFGIIASNAIIHALGTGLFLVWLAVGRNTL
jgi:hypothetical protein